MSWLRSIELRGLAAAITCALLAPAALAQEGHEHHAPATKPAADAMGGGCDSFKWPLDKERAAFADANLEKAASGAARGPLKEQFFVLALVPANDIAFTVQPGKKKDDGFGGLVAFYPPEKPGVYQVTLSSEGWIDLVQEGKALDSADHSGAKKCPGLRKSVRFMIGAAPVMLQISGAPAGSIKIGIRPAE
jgi:hypothetical protein